MQRPPNRANPPVLFSRGTSEWINRVDQKHRELVGLGLSAEKTARLDRWSETEFVYATLNLEGVDVSREFVTGIVSLAYGSTTVDEPAQAATHLLASLRMVTSLARARGKQAELTTDLLRKIQQASDAGFRTGAGDTSRVPRPAAPEHLPGLIENACQWYVAESFAELNPVEQASIVLLRLIDLQPFERANQRSALVAASLFTLRRGLPPIIISPEKAPSFESALDEGAGMNTKPMVETIAEAIERSLIEMIEEAE